ncbi:MAG: hypothetical protein Q8S54_11690 [Bacteroidota bacterium]|nr:hypothetical protein [Bacteroidota bacterium]
MAGGKGKIEGSDGIPFKKNDPRINRTGRAKKLPDLDKLLIETLGEHVNGHEALKGILIALRKKATAGDVRATELLLDRAYGKLKQSNDFVIEFDSLSEADLDTIINRLLKSKQ